MDLLQLWRETRDLAVARRWSEGAPDDGTKLPTGRGRDAVEAWDTLDRSPDPAVVPALLAAIHTGTAAQAARRVWRLAERDDPRVVLAMLQWLEDPPHRTLPGCKPFWDAVMHALEESGPAHFGWAAIGRRVQGEGTAFAMALGRRIERLDPLGGRPLTLQERREHGFPAPPAAPTNRAIPALLSRVYDHPDDLEARAVLADALLERDDPRGAFIRLQLQRAASDEPTGPVERELFGRHGATWLDPRITAMGEVGWWAGFPRTLDLRGKRGHIGRLAHEPTLATVRELRLQARDHSPKTPMIRGLASAHLRNLHSLHTVDVIDLPSLWTRHGERLIELGVWVHDRFALAELGPELRRWSGLRRLTVVVPRDFEHQGHLALPTGVEVTVQTGPRSHF